MDSHHIGRVEGPIDEVLKQVQPKTLVVGIETDLLFQISEQRLLAEKYRVPGWLTCSPCTDTMAFW